MRKIVIVIALIIASSNLHSQALFSKIYNPNNTWATAFNVFPVDSGYVSCGTMGDSINGLTNIVVSKYDINGNQILFREYKKDSFYSFAGSFSGGGLAKCKNGGFAISATQTDYIKSKVILIRLNNNLDTIWTKEVVSDTFQFGPKHCIETTDKGFIMCGEKLIKYPIPLTLVWFCKTDSMGNKLFEKLYDITIGIKGTKLDAGWNITETPDKGFLLGCYTYDNAYQGTGDGIVIKTDSLGNLAWMKNYGGPEKDVRIVTAVCNDGNYIVASNYSYFTADYNDYWRGKIRLTKINPNGNTIWMKEYFGVTEGLSVTKIIQLSNGDFIIGGDKFNNRNPHQSFWDAYLLKTNAQGDSIWCHDYSITTDTNNTTWNSIINIETTTTGGYIACGEVFVAGVIPNNIWLLKTDSNGYAPGCDPTLSIVQSPIQIKKINIYPNPANEFTIISYNITDIQLNNAVIEVYDVMGHFLSRVNLNSLSGEQIFNCTSYVSGQYLCKLINNGKLINTVKFNVIH